MVIASKGGLVAENEIEEIGRDLLGKTLCLGELYDFYFKSNGKPLGGLKQEYSMRWSLAAFLE